MSKFHQVTNEEGWIYPVMKGYRMGCCECSLVHDITFEAYQELEHPFLESEVAPDPTYKVRMLVTRNTRSTAALRREDKKRKLRSQAQ